MPPSPLSGTTGRAPRRTRATPFLAAIATTVSVGCSLLFDPDDLARGQTSSTTTAGSTTASTSATAASTNVASTSTGLPTCDGETCSGRGTCEEESGTPTCVCEDRFAGARCEDCSVAYRGPACAACADGYQDENDDGTCEPACNGESCSGNGKCDDADGTVSCVCNPLFSGAACETPCTPGTAGDDCDFRLVYSLDLPVTAAWSDAASVPYGVDASAAVGAFDRIAYRLVLDDDVVWVELDAYTDDATHLGIPFGWTFAVDVTGVEVRSFATNVDDIAVPVNGNVEMWSDCYQTGAGGVYDAHDDIGGETPDCSYGSFQVHAEDQTIFAINAWATGDPIDIGIGESTGQHPDWTFEENAASFGVRHLEIYVR